MIFVCLLFEFASSWISIMTTGEMEAKWWLRWSIPLIAWPPWLVYYPLNAEASFLGSRDIPSHSVPLLCYCDFLSPRR